MPIFEGYEGLEKIDEGKERTVYSAIRVADHTPVILKTLHSEHPSVDMIALMYHEFQVAKDINFSGIIKTYDMIDNHNLYALVQENMHGTSLSRYLQQNRVNDLSQFLRLAIQMVKILEYLHQSNIIHKDIKPSNFIYDQKSEIIKLTDFNFSSKLMHEIQEIVPPSKLEGTLAYMAPEQTGRMNINIDYRVDYYSLGVTFFEMLTGSLPYNYSDPLEMLHAHLANPVPAIRNPELDIPPVIEEIIQKLMAKNPNNRYQSTIGLQFDLEHCLELLDNKGRIDSFELAQQDIHNRLNLSQKLYGREHESQVLLKAYERVSRGGVEALMVCGFSGIGKTMLINEVHKPMVKEKGYFIHGKFDQLLRDKPYTAVTDALNQLARHILAESDTNFEKLKAAIKDAVGNIGQVIIDLAPDFELIIGPQLPLEELPPKETENRMKIYFKRFLNAVIDGDHPLVIFIDDLQWADSGSLSLLEDIMMDDEMNHLLLIGAYRDNEVDTKHPLNKFIEKLVDQKKNLQTIALPPLDIDDFSNFLQDSLYRDADSVAELAKLIHQRTEGNPFFCKQVLNLIYRQGYLKFNYQKRIWDWNLNEIVAIGITDNVVELMVDKLDELPVETKSLLKFAACIGNQFTIDFLMLITNKSAQEIGKALWPALEQELLITPRSGYKRMNAMQKEFLIEKLSKDIVYQFIHDRVQQAAYQNISDADKAQIHLDIAHILTGKEVDDIKKEKLFEVVDHFNHALNLLSESERKYVAKLNYRAGLQARNATAYKPMLNYLSTALGLIDENNWDSDYQVTFEIHQNYLLSLFLLRQTDKAEELVQRLLLKAKTNLDKAELYHIQIMNEIELEDRAKVLQLAKQAFNLFGINLVTNPNPIQMISKLIYVRWKMRKFLKGNFATELPVIDNPEIAMIFVLIQDVWFTMYEKGTEPFVYLILLSIDLLLQHGRSKNVGLFLVGYAMVIMNVYKDIETAIQYCNIVEKFYLAVPDKYSSSSSHMLEGAFIDHWHFPLIRSLELEELSLQESRESGNMLNNVFCLVQLSFTYAAEAKSINKPIETLEITYSHAASRGASDMSKTFELISLLYLNLKEDNKESDRLLSLKNAASSFESLLMYETSHKYISFYHFFRGEYDKSIEYYFKWDEFEDKIRYELFTLEVKAVNALTLMRELPKVETSKKFKYKRHIRKLMRDIEWGAKSAPINYLHHFLFLKGYEAQSKNNYIQALTYYKKAIENASKSGFILWMAFGYELIGDHFIDIGQEHLAIYGYRDAYYYYVRYGMLTKANAIKQRFPECAVSESKSLTISSGDTLKLSDSSSTGSTSVALDFMSVIKASQAISGEIILDKLFEKMLHVVLENAGATKAVIIECRKDNLLVVASLKITNDGELFKMLNLDFKDSDEICHSIVQYVIRARELAILDNAITDSRFNQDPYIIKNQPKSILSLPLLQQDVVLGVIYFENNLTEGAFTQNHVTVLKTLAAQIAISLQNSQYIANMEKLYHSTERFVPKQFLEIINKRNIEEVVLGDSAKRNITILFNDIRSFTTLVEDRSPEDAFAFVNRYWKFMAPIIRKYNGYIDHYQGDAILAIFSSKPQDAVSAAINMMKALADFNQVQAEHQDAAINMGIGISTGPAMLGIIGEEERQVSGLISDVANTASRVEGLNKIYGSRILISGETAQDLPNDLLAQFRKVDVVRLKGKHLATEIYEFIEWQDQLTSPLSDYLNRFTNAFTTYEKGNFKEAQLLFQECLNVYPGDKTADMLRKRCIKLEKVITPADWDGVYTLTHK